MDFTFSVLPLGLAGEGLGLFFTSIQDSESRSGRLAERPLGIVLRFDTSKSVLVFCFIGVEATGEPGAGSKARTQFRQLLHQGLISNGTRDGTPLHIWA